MKILLITFLLGSFAVAQDYSDPVSDGEVVIEKPTDLTQSYRDRRGRYGILFSANYEKFSPNNYVSLIQNKTFEEMSSGDSIQMGGIEMGLKFNFMLGSLTGLVGYAGGNYKNIDNKVEAISVKITKATLNFALDNLMNEPFFVPYGQVGVNQIDWTEESRDGTNILKEETFVTDWNLNYKVGMLFQLNWLEDSIDSNTHTNGLLSSGLQNTFLDIFYTSYAEPSQAANVAGVEGDANLASDNFGIGLKLEF